MRLVRYPESERLSRQIAGAWAAFARNGRPTHPELSVWPPYDLGRRPTMIFDAARSQAVDDPDRDERMLLRDLPSGRLL
jgi:para-nitrobenzyl esterase